MKYSGIRRQPEFYLFEHNVSDITPVTKENFDDLFSIEKLIKSQPVFYSGELGDSFSITAMGFEFNYRTQRYQHAEKKLFFTPESTYINEQHCILASKIYFEDECSLVKSIEYNDERSPRDVIFRQINGNKIQKRHFSYRLGMEVITFFKNSSGVISDITEMYNTKICMVNVSVNNTNKRFEDACELLGKTIDIELSIDN